MSNLEFKAPIFLQPVVLEISGLKPATLQTWVTRGLVELDSQNPGTGKKRLYRAPDIIQLTMMRKLTALGVTPSRASSITRHVMGNFVKNANFSPDLTLILFPPKDTTAVNKSALVIESEMAFEDFTYQVSTCPPQMENLALMALIEPRVDPEFEAAGHVNGRDTLAVIRVGAIAESILKRLAKIHEEGKAE